MIGIFDSGIGGLTVASAIRRLSPSADFVYFGDLANMPFGEKSEAELLEITKRAIRFLMDHGATEIVAACNSVSMLASGLRSEISVPIIEMSEPTVRALRDRSNGSILVAATEATIRSGMYTRAFASEGIIIDSIAIPALASAIEQDASMAELRSILLSTIDRAISLKHTTLILGCTQYPFVRSVFEDLFRERMYAMDIFDPAHAVAQQVVSQFQTHGNAFQTFFVSRPSDVFHRTVQRCFADSPSIQTV